MARLRPGVSWAFMAPSGALASRALLDLRAAGVRLGALVGLARVGERHADGAALRLLDEVHEIGRALVDGGLECALQRARAVQQRLVVAREQTAGTVVGHGISGE